MKKEIHVEAVYRIHTGLIEGLSYMGTLNEIPRTDETLDKPLGELFQFAKKRMKLGGRDRHLPGALSAIRPPLDPSAPKWVTDTDMRHTVASIGYLLEISRGEQFTTEETKIVASAMIVHDCAYPVTKDFADFTNPQARMTHMEEAKTEFIKYAESINKQFPAFYSEDAVNCVCRIVEQHDNPGIEVNGETLVFSYNPPPERLLWAHREADRLWMLDKGGFALDLIRRLVEANPWYNPGKYLKHVVSKHLEEARSYPDSQKCIEHDGHKSIYRTKTGYQIFLRLIAERKAEYK